MPRKTFRKIITSPELIEQINPKNKKLMTLFLKDKERKCSPATIKNYKSDLTIFFCWNVEHNENKFYPEIKKFEMSEFFSFTIDEMQFAGKRFARMRSVLSGLSECVIKYYDEEYGTFRNFINSVIEAIPKSPVRKKTVFSDAEIDLLLDTLKAEKSTQQACLLALAVYSGCRIAELEQFTIETINENNIAFGGVMLETTHPIRCKGFGKEGEQTKKFVIKDLFIPYYNEWIKERAIFLKNLGKEDNNALFINSKGDKASQGVFRDWAVSWEKIVNKPFYFHACRHRMVSALLERGLTKDYVVAIMSWKTFDMVNVYSDLEEKDRKWEDSTKLQEMICSELQKEEKGEEIEEENIERENE